MHWGCTWDLPLLPSSRGGSARCCWSAAKASRGQVSALRCAARLPRPNRRLSPTPRTATMQNRSPITMRSPLNPNRRLPPPGPLPLNAPSPSLPRRSQHRIRWTCAPQARRPPPKCAPAAPQKASWTRTWNCVPPAPSKFPVQIWSRPWRLSRQQSSRSSPTRNRPLHRSRNPYRSRNRPPTCRNQKLLSWMMISRIFRQGWIPPRWKQPARRTKKPRRAAPPASCLKTMRMTGRTKSPPLPSLAAAKPNRQCRAPWQQSRNPNRMPSTTAALP